MARVGHLRAGSFGLFALIALLFLTSCTSREASSTETVNGVTISVEGATIELRSEGLSENLAQRIKSLTGVVEVDRYLSVSTRPYNVVGVEPEAPLRLDGAVAKVRVGRSFEATDDRVAIPGRRVNSGEYIQSTMPGMFHSFSVGQSFVLRGEKVRVVGVL